ncbi:transglutaminase family protein [Lachnospiraceae bacterium 29-84]
MILLGMFLCLEKLLSPTVYFGDMALLAEILAVGVVVIGLGRRQACIGSLLFLCAWAGAIFWGRDVLVTEGKEMVNRILEMVNKYYHTEYLLWYLEEGSQGRTLLFLLVCGMFGFLEAAVFLLAGRRQRRIAVLSVLPLLAVATCLSLGQDPSSAGVFLMLSGILASQLDLLDESAISWCACVQLILVGSILCTRGGPVLQFMEANHDTWLKRQIRMEDRMLDLIEDVAGIRLFHGNRAQSEFLLENNEPEITGREVFTITLDHYPSHDIYLRGFVGGDYENGRWEGVSKQEFSDWSQQHDLSNEDFVEAVKQSPYRILQAGSARKELYGLRSYQVSMKLKRSIRSYTLAPYFTEIPEGIRTVADGTMSPIPQRDFEWTSYLFLNAPQKSVSARISFDDGTETSRAWKLYEDYAKETYTRLPEEGLSDLKAVAESKLGAEHARSVSYFDEYARSISYLDDFVLMTEDPANVEVGEKKEMTQFQDIEYKSMLIQEILSDTVYSLNLQDVPDGQDFTEYFLLGQKKGYCVHYATAGTLLFRMYGIPARYVSGYLVFSSDFKPNGDGTYTATVTDARGHAWTEVFQRNVGFYPVELTPYSYTSMLRDVGEGEDLKEKAAELEGWMTALRNGEDWQQPLEETEEEEEGVEEEETEEEIRTKPEEPLEEEGSKAGQEADKSVTDPVKENLLSQILPAAKWIAAMLAILGFLFWILYHQRKRAIHRWEEASCQEDRTAATAAIGRRISRILNILGYQKTNGSMGDWEYGAFLQEKIPGPEWEELIFVLQKAAYSKTGVEEAEYQKALHLYHVLVEKLCQEKGKIRKWIFEMR